MSDLNTLFINLCALLRAILAHGAGNKRLRQVLTESVAKQRNIYFKPAEKPAGAARAVAHLCAITFGIQGEMSAGKAAETPLPPPSLYEHEGIALAQLFRRFGEALAQILDHPDAAALVTEALAGLPVALEDHITSADQEVSERISTRLVMPAYLAMFAGVEAGRPEVMLYAPEVEARRIDYQEIAECWVTLARLENYETPDSATLDLPDNEQKAPLVVALHKHLDDLIYENFDWFEPRLMRFFYPEIRLAIDQDNWESKARAEKQATEKATAA